MEASKFLAEIVPVSNRIEASYARGLYGAKAAMMECSYGNGFIGAFWDDDELPTWARRAARFMRDDFFDNTPGTKKLFSDVSSMFADGDGESLPICRHALELWEAGGRKGVEPYTSAQDYGSCFPPGVMIRMADGTSRRIEDIRLGEQVVTAEGNTGKVTTLFLRDVNEPIYKIKLWGHYGLRLTKEHPILTSRGYVHAEEIRVGDEVAVTKYVTSERLVAIQTAEHSKRMVSSYARNYKKVSRKSVAAEGGVASGERRHITVCHAVPDMIHLDERFGRLVGLFLAEGNTERGKVTWTFSAEEKDTLAAECSTIIRDFFGIDASFVEKKGACKVILHSTPFAEVFESLCGTGSGCKRLHADLAAGPDTFRQAMLQGWIDGDGHARRGYVQGTTISKHLALDMFSIANQLGILPRITRSTPKASHGVIERQVRYDVYITEPERIDQTRQRQDERHVWKKVRGVVQEDYEGPVYNFAVQGDQSYVADEIGVHNCVDCSCGEHETTMFGWRAAHPAQAGVSESYLHAAAWYKYANRGYCGDGWGGSGIAAVARRVGCAFRTKYELPGGSVDFTDDDQNEQIVARTWCRSGIPEWMVSHTQANHGYADGAITAFNGDHRAMLKVFKAGGVLHAGGTRTSGGSKPFTKGSTGPHMQSSVGADDSEECRKWFKDNHNITWDAGDFPLINHQTWGSGWRGECADEYWPKHLWGPKPQGAWVCSAKWWLGDVEYAWLPWAKGFPGSGPIPLPPHPPMSGQIYAEQAGQVIAIRGEITIPQGTNQFKYIVVPDTVTGKYTVVPKPSL